ncbi:uncharacterized protein LOC129737550 [Uranotaenia lowii]|uniref:uncharacterized protein LOC129737550 n=1 Tax=Uranotaenia lowii TaxID=190385 RepID=UPI00247AE72F|nr:uncharacterized protein LOC129737550 [Uranotaenia lowii]
MTGRNEKDAPHFEEEEESNCATCTRPDSEEDMVQCDACDDWHHYSCAGVDQTVTSAPWICNKCMEAKDDDAASVHSQASSILSVSLSQMMDRQQLEREKADLEVQRRHLKEQQKLLFNAAGGIGLQNVPSLEVPSQSNAAASGIASRGLLGRFASAISPYASSTEQVPHLSAPSADRNPTPPTARSLSHHHIALRELKASVERCETSDKLSPEQLLELRKQLEHCRQLFTVSNSDKSKEQSDLRKQSGAIPKTTRNLPTVPEESRLSKQNNAIGECEEEATLNSWRIKQSVSQNGLPLQQVVARQSLGRDLPRFSGDPTEWPIFISNYEFTTEACGFSDAENMLRLQRCLTGAALESVRSRLVLPAGVPQVIERLRRRYGRPELLINGLLKKVREIPALKTDRLEGLISFSDAVQTLCAHIEAAREHTHLSNPSLLQELILKLPSNHQMMWARYQRQFSHVNLQTFNEYMDMIVEDASSIVSLEPEITTRVSGRDRQKPKAFINAHAEDWIDAQAPKESMREYVCVNCDQVGHRIAECRTFKALSIEDRWRIVRSKNLCQNCLYNHGRRSCRLRQSCNIENCRYRHHRLLHPEDVQSTPVIVAENHFHRDLNISSLFRILPVKLFGELGCVETFAFLDEGSDLTLVENELASNLGVKGDLQPLCLKWTGDTSRLETESQRISLQISGANPDKRYSNAKPRILIGIDNLRLALPLKVKEGDSNGPVAVKTRLGWCVYGPRLNNTEEANIYHISKCNCETDLQESVKRFLAVEASGTSSTHAPPSEEEQRALTLLESTTKRIGNRFETGLLFKDNYVEFPDSYAMAENRLVCLERRMQRHPALKENLHRQIREYESKGYAHKASMAELESADPRKTWYLPIGAVTNPKKPGKVRIIWDAAAKSDGVSLNSVLLKGPDQLVALPGVLFRFRQYRVAVTSDIQEMFHQIRIRKEDIHSQRFLWRSDPSEKPTIYLMDVATFGSTCSPASAQFVKNRNAEIHSQLYPEAAQAIIRDHYVDDYLASFESEEEALRVARDVRTVHGNGGFKLHNWRSNDATVLQGLGEEKTQTAKRLELSEGGQTERVLGMLWNPSDDLLCFSTQMSEEVHNLIVTTTRPTKRFKNRSGMDQGRPSELPAVCLIQSWGDPKTFFYQ